MRLPGTFNLGGRNNLPTAEFLMHYEKLKRAKEKARSEREANNGNKLEFGDKPLSKAVTTGSKKGGCDAKKNWKAGDVVLTPDEETFSPLQDSQLIKMKIEGKTWKEITTELGKDEDAIKSRFKEVKPSNFDDQAAKWKMENNGGGGKKNKGKKDNQNNQNNQSQQQEGKANNNNNNSDNQNKQHHEGKKNKNKNKNNQQDHQKDNYHKTYNKKEEAQAFAGADNDDTSDAGTWAVADENFTEREVRIAPFSPNYCSISYSRKQLTPKSGHRSRKDC